MTQRIEQQIATVSAGAARWPLTLVGTRMTPVAKEWRRYDRMLGPAGRGVLEAARLSSGQRVLDVFAGTGGITLEAAHRVGPHGAAVGIDSELDPIQIARARAAEQLLSWVTFAVGDVEGAELPARVFDAVISRFGLSNVGDPGGALSRVAATLAPGGRIAFVCWRSASENLWYTLPRRIVAEYVGADCARAVEASAQGPRPFAFADRDQLAAWLRGAGYSAISIEAWNEPIWIGDDVDDAVEFFFETDARKLDERLDQRRFERLIRELRRAFAEHERADGVRVAAGTWIVSARV